MIWDHPKSVQIFPDHSGATQMIRDHPRSVHIIPNHPRSFQIIWDHSRSFHRPGHAADTWVWDPTETLVCCHRLAD